MNQETVVNIIAEYLRSNRRLVIPSFGAIMVKESGERLFSDLLRDDDGVFASLLRERGYSEMEAAVTVDRFIFELRHELQQYGYCRLGEVGTLRVEPSSGAIRLYPPVQCDVELPTQTPYIPKPIVEEEEKEEQKAADKELERKDVVVEEKSVETPITPTSAIKQKKRPRKRSVDVVMVVAVLILLAALVGIAYGWYVSSLTVDDDAKMDALRVTPEQVIN